jgi:hypothetical protein
MQEFALYNPARISTHLVVARGAGRCARAASAGRILAPSLPPDLRKRRRGALSRPILEKTTAS